MPNHRYAGMTGISCSYKQHSPVLAEMQADDTLPVQTYDTYR